MRVMQPEFQQMLKRVLVLAGLVSEDPGTFVAELDISEAEELVFRTNRGEEFALYFDVLPLRKEVKPVDRKASR